jgi:hypothetical protein
MLVLISTTFKATWSFRHSTAEAGFCRRGRCHVAPSFSRPHRRTGNAVLAYIVRRWPFSRSKSALLVLSSSLPANVRSSPKVTALLGDANFPTSAVSHYKDGRQLLIQDLYERYSGLAFTMPADRSIAILGLQERLSPKQLTDSSMHISPEACFGSVAIGSAWSASSNHQVAGFLAGHPSQSMAAYNTWTQRMN